MTNAGRGAALLATVLAGLLVLSGCASLPESSAPQALGTINRAPTSEGPPPPQSGRDPDLLVGDFLTASADPANRHAAARQYMAPDAAAEWNDEASTTIVDRPDTLRESRSGDKASYVIRARKVGELAGDGSYRAVEGTLENKIEMSKIDGEWRITDLPDGVVFDSSTFEKVYRRYVLQYVDPASSVLVPDPRWVSVPRAQLTERLIAMLGSGPQSTIAPVVRNQLAAPISVRGPITKANNEPGEVGIGIGGVRIDFAGAGTLGQRERELLAAQVVMTLAGADILGPYVLLADGKPLDDRYAANGWSVADLDQFSASAPGQNRIGLHALRNGTLVQVTQDGIVTPSGSFGEATNLQSVGISADGQFVAAVADTGRPAPEPGRTLLIGNYGAKAFGVAEGATIARPSWTSDGGAAWTVVDGDRVIRAVTDRATGNVSVQDVDTSALFEGSGAPRPPISEVAVSRTGVRAALIADGKVYVAVVERGGDGRYALTRPVPVALGLSTRAVSLSWVTGDTLMVAREGNVDPVFTVSIDGSQFSPVTSQNLTPPVRVVTAAPATQYVADSRAVLQLQTADPARNDRFWREVPGLTGDSVVPVLPS
ncbi:lipoprotein LpqB [Nocardia neocaledoniensis NBRC 108232]|uniref:Lipoprotein LpqB n=1 Tax=Nocardia neocaledoniensis TaxID=236511 RepID=A0A317NWG9_9NOCA|nr:MtrAB system accessory lipoprotein LpqB [Nocardia neocaledoniensis]PWV79337.1 sporulation and spore germination protein [Nocardia neocaledoniensis]GEM35460.1 lipoprotein LpqB [Nocardia neocaledoniensis NBRC 108232]